MPKPLPLALLLLTATARAICLDCALAIDMGNATGEEGWQARAALLTPVAKAFGTDVGCEVTSLAMQVFGGMGYIEETGIAQFWRDVRVTAIYEGTNGIQAMDLVGRKLADGGAAAQKLIETVEETARQEAGELGARLAAARRVAQARARRPAGDDRRLGPARAHRRGVRGRRDPDHPAARHERLSRRRGRRSPSHASGGSAPSCRRPPGRRS